MRVGVNLLKLSQDRFGGVEQYVKNLIWHLINNDETLQLFLFLTRPSRDMFPDFQRRIKKVMIKESKIQSSIYKIIDGCQLDLWFSPLHRSYIPNISLPTVVTIHDVLHTSYPHFVPGELEENNQYYQHFSPSFDAVLTVSEFSKKAITKHLHIPEVKIHAIHLDAPPAFHDSPDEDLKVKIKNKYNLHDAYAIYPASYNPHKNHLNLLKAIVLLRDNYKKRVPLVLTGFTHKENMIYQSVLQFIKNYALENQVNILGYIPPEEMPYVYFNSSFMVFPSLYEGFGIPLVEAMKAQCPIVCSNKGSIPEIVADAALQFNPADPEDIALKMLKLMDCKTREILIKKGKERAKTFSWKKCAQETLHVFRSVITNSSPRREGR